MKDYVGVRTIFLEHQAICIRIAHSSYTPGTINDSLKNCMKKEVETGTLFYDIQHQRF